MLERDGLARQMRAESMEEAEIMDSEPDDSGVSASPNAHVPFSPTAHALPDDFCLLQYSELRGRVSKMPTKVLQQLLDGLEPGDSKRGLAMDASVLPCRLGGLSCLQTVHQSYPMLKDPWLVGRVAGAALMNSLFALGVVAIDNLMMTLTLSSKMTDKEREIIVPLLMKGFKDAAKEAGTSVSGGAQGLNPWLSIGGCATSVCSPQEYILPHSAQLGDVLVLTKPLGTQVALNALHWAHHTPTRWERLKAVLSLEEVERAHARAVSVMSRLNAHSARLMHKYSAHGATEVGPWGLLGHATTLARSQQAAVCFVIHNLPVIAKMSNVAKSCGNMFNLLKGEAAEVSGGLLICLPREQAAAFCKDTEKTAGSQSWIIGIVEKGDRSARIIDKPRVIEVPSREREGELW